MTFLKDLFLMDYEVILSFWVLGLAYIYFLSSLISDIKSFFNYRRCISTVSTNRLVQEIILFTNDILVENGITYFPPYKISYHPHKKFLGTFDDTQILIYIKNIHDIKTLIFVLMHEIQHFIQSQVNVAEYAKYERHSQRWGYVLNPLEIQSNLFAYKWLNPCLKHLKSKKIIKNG